MKSESGIKLLFISCAAVVVIIIAMSSPSSAPTIEKAWTPDNFDAYTMGKHFIERGLKAPSTADFASIHKSTVTNLGGNKWMVRSYVDSQNGFGAMIRTHFEIKMLAIPKTKTWQVIEIDTDI